MNKPTPLNRDNNGVPNISALKGRGFINQGSTLPYKVLVLVCSLVVLSKSM